MHSEGNRQIIKYRPGDSQKDLSLQKLKDVPIFDTSFSIIRYYILTFCAARAALSATIRLTSSAALAAASLAAIIRVF